MHLHDLGQQHRNKINLSIRRCVHIKNLGTTDIKPIKIDSSCNGICTKLGEHHKVPIAQPRHWRVSADGVQPITGRPKQRCLVQHIILCHRRKERATNPFRLQISMVINLHIKSLKHAFLRAFAINMTVPYLELVWLIATQKPKDLLTRQFIEPYSPSEM